MTATDGPDPTKIDQLLARARREVDEGLLPSCQVAVAFEGELVCSEAFGAADLDTKYCLYSATKPFVASTLAMLIGEGLVDPASPVADYLEHFGRNDKASVTVEQVMLHQGGIPYAPMEVTVWNDREQRLRQMGEWTLDWVPGSCFEYHPTAAHWVQAAIIEEVTGHDFRDVVHDRLTAKIGLPRMVGIPYDEQATCAEAVLVGEPATPDEMKAVFGVTTLPARDYVPALVLSMNDALTRATGVPGAGGFGRAADVALYYQELLHNGHDVWTDDVLSDITGNVRSMLPDRYTGVPAYRTLAMIVAGDDGRANLRGLGRTVSPRAFGHSGAGGQLGWADPATGLSLGYTTNGFDRNEVRQPRRDTAIASLAAACVSPR